MQAEKQDSRQSQPELRADRPFLEQLEELGAEDARISAWLEREIYPNPEIMSLLDPMTLMRIKGSA